MALRRDEALRRRDAFNTDNKNAVRKGVRRIRVDLTSDHTEIDYERKARDRHRRPRFHW